LVLKSAFALIGMGAYLAIFLDVPLKPLAIALTALFATLNIVGAKQSSGFLRVLVLTLLAVLGAFIVDGLVEFVLGHEGMTVGARFTPFMPEGIDGLLATVGLVFVSYIGLTKVASLAEEVTDPDRNIPLGMALSLGSVTLIYVLGVFIMVAALGPGRLSASLTPVADTAGVIFHWLPGRIGVLLVVAAAIAAFASMSNAGIMAASRYPLAMARDHLVPDYFKKMGRFRTPVPAILITCTVLVVFLVVLDVEQVAKLASSLQLTIFALVNVAVVVMRESRIEAYDPGFRSPLYPWMQLAGIVFPFVLVAEMGWFPALFTMAVVTLSLAWYTYYARGHLAREGAIYHVFERLGRRRFAGLDRELREIMQEKGLRAEDPFDVVIARAEVIDLPEPTSLERIIADASERLAVHVPATAVYLAGDFSRGTQMGGTPVSHGAALLHTRLPGFDDSGMVLVRCSGGVRVDTGDESLVRQASQVPIRAVFFLVSGESDPGRHLRILAQLAGRVDDDGFMDEWVADLDEQELKETLLRDDRFLSLRVETGSNTETLIGRALRELEMPEGSLVAMILRRGQPIVPRGGTVLEEGDRLTILGEPVGLQQLEERFGYSARP
jgi:amino acid transporter/mannitol/fructose-specific phosphotransferase system IIA component (Ntr-type)